MMLSQIAAVYSHLGLGAPAAAPLTGRIGCTKVLEIPVLHAGWGSLVGEIDAARAKTIAASERTDVLASATQWLALSAAAFVAESAHRGTKLCYLTFGALFLHPYAMLLNDKEDGDRIRPRLVPRTDRIQAILAGCLECHAIVRLHCLEGDEHTVIPDDPLFVSWTEEGGQVVATPLGTAVIADITRRLFKSEANFGRSQWVTHSDEFSVNRWFIRLLTGHARDVSRVDGAYFDVSPLEACRQAQPELEGVGARIFGPSLPTNCPPPQPVFELAASVASPDTPPFTDRVPDPRTLLPAFSTDTLVRWRIVVLLRERLSAGDIDADLDVLAVLHEVIFDHVPDFETAVAAVCDPARHIRLYGACAGLTWNRPHFLHPTWIPLRATTARLVDRAGRLAPLTADGVRARVAKALDELDFVEFPDDPETRITALMEVAAAFRRLELPTSMNAVSHPLVPAPALSPTSLMRLSGLQLPPVAFKPNPKRRKDRLEKEADIAYIQKVLAHAADTRLKLGETQKRAGVCLTELAHAPVVWTPYGRWLLEITKDQLHITRTDPSNGLKVSSWHTYFCTLTTAKVDPHEDPRDWDEHNWHEWIDRIDERCRHEESGAPSADAESEKRRKASRERMVCDRAKHALCAVVSSLERLQEHVPHTVRQRLLLNTTQIVPYSSASATIILAADHPAIDALLARTHAEYPADLSLLRFRTQLGRIVPVRKGDVSSTRSNCITPGNAVIFEPVGYSLHKTDAAVRSVSLTREQADSVRSCLADIERHFGAQPLACRTDGTPAAGFRDARLAHDYSRALKSVTGDVSAREHSVRASTMQHITWPGWEAIARKLLAGELTVADAAEWCTSLETEWLRTARAMIAAGHADLHAGLGNYLAAWPLIYGIRATASLAGIRVGPKFLQQLGISPAALRKARSRANARATDGGCSSEAQVTGHALAAFDELGWVTTQCVTSNLQRWQLADTAATAAPLKRDGSPKKPDARIWCGPTSNDVGGSKHQHSAAVASPLTVTYLTIRALGLSRERAMERLDLRLGQALGLEPAIPSLERVSAARKRSQSEASARGSAADIQTALSPLGLSTLSWLLGLSGADFRQLCAVLHSESLPAEHLEFWTRLKNTIPAPLRISLRIGKKYVTAEHLSGYQDLEPTITLTADKRIGARTVASFYVDSDNKVETARTTAAIRVQALCAMQLRNSTSEENRK